MSSLSLFTIKFNYLHCRLNGKVINAWFPQHIEIYATLFFIIIYVLLCKLLMFIYIMVDTVMFILIKLFTD